MSAILAVKLPLHNTRALAPNGGHGHWAVKGMATGEARRWARLATLEALAGRDPCELVDPFTRYELRAVWRLPKRGRVMDDDNAKISMKPYRDGIAEVLNLNDACMVWARDIEWVRGAEPGITIEVWPIA